MILKFLVGFITGVVTTVLVLLLIYFGGDSNEALTGLTIFPEKGECITNDELEVFQTVEPSMALARFDEFPATLVLLVNYEGKYYYDGQKIGIPAGKCARQIGIYQYETKMEMLKTVPVVVIE